jgi:hypothetical protein
MTLASPHLGQGLGGVTGDEGGGDALALLTVQSDEGAAETQGDGGINGVAAWQAEGSCDVGGLLGQGRVQRHPDQVRQVGQDSGELARRLFILAAAGHGRSYLGQQ